MSRENRKNIRRPIYAASFIYTSDGWPICACQVEDVSEGGARLILPAIPLPADIILSLSRNGKVRRLCEVVWSHEDKVGIRFKKVTV
jgi:hypothetical protein